MFLAGSLLDQLPGRKYTASLRFFEFAPRSPWPRPATLTRMRHQLPEGLRVALRAPRTAVVGSAGPLRLDEAAKLARESLFESAERLGAVALVVPTPAELTPGARSAELLARYFDGVSRDAGRHLVWAPRGAWEPEQSAELAASLGLVCAYDPIHGERPAGPVVYAQLTAMGYQHNFSTASLEESVESVCLAPFDEAYLSIDSPRSFKQAELLQQLADAAQAN